MADEKAPIEKIYEAVLEKMGEDDDGRHVCRVLFQDIRDYLDKEGRDPAKVPENEILRLALTGMLTQKEGKLSSYEAIIANAEVRTGLPQAISAYVKERMRVIT